uniref:Uncharacterized protein n=1 Tax=Rhizophora mucronata TaxID=61149 RepID=A0A2P2PJV9_RHIMU
MLVIQLCKTFFTVNHKVYKQIKFLSQGTV